MNPKNNFLNSVELFEFVKLEKRESNFSFLLRIAVEKDLWKN